jgi:hypothetical protein
VYKAPNTQFLNDLLNPDIDNLNNLKWIFDKKKYIAAGNLEENFEKYMKDAIKKIEFPNNFNFTKFGSGITTEIKLRELLDTNFTTIFSLK